MLLRISIKNGAQAKCGGISVKWSKKWKMSRKNLIIIVVFTLLSLLWCFAPVLIARCAAAEITPASKSYIKVPTVQWEQLKSNTKLLEANLILLEQNLTVQEQRSAELTSLLQQAKNELTKTQQALQTASASLVTAEKSLQTATEYTAKLRKQIEAEREAAAEAKERAYWKGWLNGFCVGLVTTGIAVITK